VPVDLGQAGQQVVCTCGTRLEVPPLRQLRQLPIASTAENPPHSRWNVRYGVITANLILAALFAAIGGFNWYTAPSSPEFNAEVRANVVKEGISKLSPADAWNLWVNSYLPLARAGLQRFQIPNQAALRQEIAQHRFLATMMFIPAGIFLAVAVIAAARRS
jgi:hypothetical protein